MFKNKFSRSLSVILVIALLLTAVGSTVPLNFDSEHFINGSVNASLTEEVNDPVNELTADNEETEANEELAGEENPDSPEKLNLLEEFTTDSADGKVNVIIGFVGEPARDQQHQAKLVQQTAVINSFGGDVERGFTIINAVSARLPLQAVEALSKRNDVSYVEPDYEVFAIAQQTPWGVDRVFGPETYSFPSWEQSRGQGIAVAIFDTGIDENHVDLPSLSGGINTIDSTHWGSDIHGHGTHVAGTVAAVDNNKGLVGIAPSVSLYAVKVMDDNGRGTTTSVVKGIEWALDNNISIINMSLGGPNYSQSLNNAVDNAYARGVLLVAAAGNDGDSADNVLYPARYSSVIAVSASDSKNQLASFSSRGPSIELIAPGVSIYSLYPDNRMAYMSGTSMSSPHVAGVAAVLWGADSTMSNTKVRQLLQQTAEDLGLSSNHQGYGLVRADLVLKQVLPLLSSDANLSNLKVSVGTLGPAFSPDITAYQVDVAHDISSIDLTAILSGENASMTNNDEPVYSGEAKTITLNNSGLETEIKIVITAEDGITEKKYTITVDRDTEPQTTPTWTQVASKADAISYSDGVLAATFAHGTWLYDGEWERISSKADAISYSDGVLAATFAHGTWLYDGEWERISSKAEAISYSDGVLAAIFEHGTWLYEGGTWTRVASKADAISYSDGVLAATFAHGTWLYDGEWERISSKAEAISYSNGVLAVIFEHGTWLYDGGWTHLSNKADAISYSDGILAAIFAHGTLLYEGDWTHLSNKADAISCSVGVLAATFEHGTWLYK